MGKCGTMWGDMGNVCLKVSDQFWLSIYSENNLEFLAYYFEATTKSNWMHFVKCGCWVMWENDEEGGTVWGSLAMQTI